MGGKSSSSSASTANTTTNTKNINLQGVQGTQVFTDREVNVTDGGAIAGSLAIGQDAVSAVSAISAAFLDANKQSNDATLGLSKDIASGAAEIASNATRDTTGETIQALVKWGAGAAVAVAGVYIFTKGK